VFERLEPDKDFTLRSVGCLYSLRNSLERLFSKGLDAEEQCLCHILIDGSVSNAFSEKKSFSIANT